MRPLPLGYGRRRAGQVGNGIGFDAYALRSLDGALVRERAAGQSDRTSTSSWPRPSSIMPWKARARAHAPRSAQFLADPAFAAGTTAAAAQPLSRAPIRASTAWGMSDRPQRLHRLQRVRGRLPGGEQHPGGRQGAGRARPRDALDPRRPLLRRRRRDTPRTRLSSRCRACTARTRRARWCARSAATVHDAEGLNVQVYNRCVGTRYCSNNCPYKVRRFNFLQYADLRTREPQGAAQPRRHRAHPRRDGEMHLLRAAHRDGAHRTRTRTDRRIATARCVTACQAACPTQAIVFGDLNDPTSAVEPREGARRATTRARRAQHAAAHDVSRAACAIPSPSRSTAERP